ncbi:glycosyltransferase family 2 protein [candidate division CSSED10-310 bacterium]|uniref:Glycosyltransferase family 2 protein n=1 Tax=candidate division CSSED10-310 bacterium TaxID=2855610 RepID=A0ABV6YRH6_UNCC1
MHRKAKITVVIPCYNEEKGIGKVLEKIPDFVDEIIVINNNSTDRTAEIARNAGARVIDEPQQGYGRAYKTGLPAAKGDVIVTMDGDGTYPTIAIAYLVDILLGENLDFISARRMPIDWTRSLNNIQRFCGNLVLTLFLAILFGKTIRDSQSGMWIFNKNILDKLNLTSDEMAFSEELKIEAFCHPDLLCREVPIQFKYIHRIGPSKLNLWHDGIQNLKFLFKKRFTYRTIKS